MKTTAVRIYGEKDLRLETFELPQIKDDEILVKIVSDSICMSSYKAAMIIEENESIYIDSGTTAMCLAEKIPDIALAVLTCAPNAAIELTNRKKVEIVLAGGRLSKDNYSVSGVVTADFINDTNIDTAFLSTSGFSPETGFTCGSLNECEIKKAVISKAKKVVLMLEKHKIDVRHMFTFAGLDDIDVIVTDEPLPAHILKLVKEKNIKII